MADTYAQLETTINTAWDNKASINNTTQGEYRDAVEQALALLDSGKVRVANPTDSGWVVNQWLKKAVLLSFSLNANQIISGGPGMANWYDKVQSKFVGWGEAEFSKAGFRAVPDSIVRHSAYVAPNAVLMPCFLNVGAYVGEGTMIDTWSTVGSCAQIGANCHISGGVGIGGVLEPLQAEPVIIEDNVFIGARSEVAEGVIVEKGSVISLVLRPRLLIAKPVKFSTGAYHPIRLLFPEHCHQTKQCQTAHLRQVWHVQSLSNVLMSAHAAKQALTNFYVTK